MVGLCGGTPTPPPPQYTHDVDIKRVVVMEIEYDT